jgi:hypothetical protein
MWKGLYSRLFPKESSAEIFSFFRNSDRLAGTFGWSEDLSPARLLVASTAEDPPLMKSGK